MLLLFYTEYSTTDYTSSKKRKVLTKTDAKIENPEDDDEEDDDVLNGDDVKSDTNKSIKPSIKPVVKPQKGTIKSPNGKHRDLRDIYLTPPNVALLTIPQLKIIAGIVLI